MLPLLAALLALQGSPTAGASASADAMPLAVAPEPLDAAALELARRLCERSPWLAAERGIPCEGAPALGVFGGRDAAQRRRALEDLGRRIELLASDRRKAPVEGETARDGAGLAAGGAAAFALECDALVAAVTVERILSDPWRAERWNAAEWVERGERVLRVDVAVGAPASILAARLDALPALLEEAGHALEPTPDPWRSDALAAVARLADLAGSLDLGPETVHSAGTRARAQAACRRFASFVAMAPNSANSRPPAMGEARWLELVETASGVRTTLGEIEASLLVDLARRERAAGIPPALGANDPAAERTSEPSVEELALEAARSDWRPRFAPLLGAVDPPAFSVRTDDLPALLGRDGLFLARTPDQAALLLAPIDHARSELARRNAILRLGVPGQALLCGSPLRGSRPAPRYLWNRALVEGWGWLALEDVLAGGRPPAASDVSGELGLETLRLLAALDAHGRGLALERVAERFARRSGLDEERARAEARRACDDPLLGIGILGLRELRRLRAAVADERTFLARVLSHPHLRPTDLALPGSGDEAH